MVEQECVGAIVCKLDMHKKMFRRGYIAMLAVDSKHRRKSIGETWTLHVTYRVNKKSVLSQRKAKTKLHNSVFCALFDNQISLCKCPIQISYTLWVDG